VKRQNKTRGSDTDPLTKTKDGNKISKSDILGVLLIFPLVLLAASDGALLLGNQVLIMADLNANIIIFGLIVGLGVLSSGIFTFVFGYMADKQSRKRLLFIGGSIWSGCTLLMSFSPGVELLFMARIFATIGLGAISPVVFSLLSDMFPSEKRGNSFAWWGIASLIGGLAGGSIALAFNKIDFEFIEAATSGMSDGGWAKWTLDIQMQYLQDHYRDLVSLWRLPFMVTGVIGLAFTVLLVFVREPKRGARDKELRDSLAKDELRYAYKIKRSDLKYIFTRRSNF